MNLVIPGAAGFVGVNLLAQLDARPELTDRFERIVLVDPLQYGVQKLPDKTFASSKYTFIQGSIYDPAVAERAIGEGDLVVHLAAEVNSFTTPQTNAEDPLRYLQCLADRSISRLLFMSSADVYGVNDSSDLLESDRVRPTTVYAAAKVAFEAYLQAFHATCSLPLVVLRPVTIFGPHQYPGWLVPRVITQAIRGEQISITGNGSVCRDWIFVEDVCDLLLKVMAFDDDRIHGEVFNVGTGHELDVLVLTKHILKTVGGDESLITFVAERPGDIPRQVTNATKARLVFGWEPTTTLLDGLARTIVWYQKCGD